MVGASEPAVTKSDAGEVLNWDGGSNREMSGVRAEVS
jgi:hypothetical protein